MARTTSFAPGAPRVVAGQAGHPRRYAESRRARSRRSSLRNLGTIASIPSRRFRPCTPIENPPHRRPFLAIGIRFCVADCLNVERSGLEVAPGPSNRVAIAGPDEGRCPTFRLEKKRPRRRALPGLRPFRALEAALEDQKDQVLFFLGGVVGGRPRRARGDRWAKRWPYPPEPPQKRREDPAGVPPDLSIGIVPIPQSRSSGPC